MVSPVDSVWKRTNHRKPALRPPILTHLAIFQPKKNFSTKVWSNCFFFSEFAKKSVTILKHRAQHTGNEYHPPSNLHCNICTQVETLPPSCAYFCLSSCWLFSVLQLTPACTFHLRFSLAFSFRVLLPPTLPLVSPSKQATTAKTNIFADPFSPLLMFRSKAIKKYGRGPF